MKKTKKKRAFYYRLFSVETVSCFFGKKRFVQKFSSFFLQASKVSLLTFIVLLYSGTPLKSQENSPELEEFELEEPELEEQELSEENETQTLLLRSGYKTVQLRMTRQEVSEKIAQDPHLELDTRSSFDLLDEEQPYILKAQRLPWIRKIYYQFLREEELQEGTPEEANQETDQEANQEAISEDQAEDRTWILYEILVHLNPKEFNYFSLYQSLSDRYGEASQRTPIYSRWKGESEEGIAMEIRLLHPSSIQILDTELYARGKRKTNQVPLRDYEAQIKEELLGDFSPEPQVSRSEYTNSE